MSLYLDASVLVTLLVIDPSSARAEAFLSAHPEIVVVTEGSISYRRIKTGGCICCSMRLLEKVALQLPKP